MIDISRRIYNLKEALWGIYNTFFATFDAPDADLGGRVCIVTGGNTGYVVK